MDSSLYELVAWAAFAGYWVLCFRTLWAPVSASRVWAQVVMVPAVLILHGVTLMPAWFSDQGLRFGFASSVSWTLWLAAMLLWVESWFQRLPRLAGTVYPVAALAVILPLWFPGSVVMTDPPALFRAHILLAMLAYSAFAAASAHALLMMSLEKSLHRGGRSSHWWDDMPSLIALDQTLARVMFAGFILLTLTLGSGIWVNLGLGFHPLRLDHKTVFTLLTWSTVGIFFVGRFLLGWRGRIAARVALIGFVLLLMAYVGSRFVLEVLLSRSVS